jgi:hypothetical protein
MDKADPDGFSASFWAQCSAWELGIAANGRLDAPVVTTRRSH